MNKLYLALKESLNDHIQKGVIPKLIFEWDYNQTDEVRLRTRQYPSILFKINNVVYSDPEDKYLTGDMEFLVKVIFKGINDPSSQHKISEGLLLLKQITSILRSIESDETGPILIKKVEALTIGKEVICYQFTCSASYYLI